MDFTAINEAEHFITFEVFVKVNSAQFNQEISDYSRLVQPIQSEGHIKALDHTRARNYNE